MRYRIGLAAMLTLAVGAGGLMAAERATFVMTDASRVSGTVVFHTEARTNIRADKNEFNLKVESGAEMPIPFAQVVAIDFAGGTPSADELSALPASGHLLTLRNGKTQAGRLVDLISGDTVRWRNADGQQSDIPITDVRRIFLRPDRIREVYNVPATAQAAATASALAPGSPQDPQARPTPQTANSTRRGRGQTADTGVTVTVRGVQPWTDTGIAVRRGDAVQFEASGRVVISRSVGTVGPDGAGSSSRRLPERSMAQGGLIGRVGDDGEPFAIGANTGAIRMPATGRLMLGINDDNFDDNSGAFSVAIVTGR